MRGIGNTVPAADVSASGQPEEAAFCRQSTEKLCIFPVRFAGREPGGHKRKRAAAEKARHRAGCANVVLDARRHIVYAVAGGTAATRRETPTL